ncbi:MAG TPA: glycosyl hydrolase family 8 [Bacteroidales bacterium]|nr:glycosyl hydrolase family 8 [Bacteroidales bacterium]
MKTIFLLLLILSVFTVNCQPAELNTEPRRPFPQSVAHPGIIKPNHVSSARLNDAVADYYDYWKSRYIRPGVYHPNTFFVQGENTGGSVTDKGTSEGHGWGMIITALMAGHDPEAKKIFDGLVRMYDVTRSRNNPYLMAWLITAKEDAGGNRGSATDGDLDVAYGLLLAHEQWGSDGEINYLQKALDMINKGIRESLIFDDNFRLRMGDSPTMPVGTRSSDWMAGHMRAFYHFSGDPVFLQVADTIYSLISQIRSTHSPQTGLMPDFVVGTPPGPSGPRFLETIYDGTFNWNACRFPLRIAVDYAHHGTPEAREALSKILDWIQVSTQGNVRNVRPGYYLNGNPIEGRDFTSFAYTAPMVAAGIIGSSHQQWLNSGWDYFAESKVSYYADTITMLSKLLISGNWWSPAPR